MRSDWFASRRRLIDDALERLLPLAHEEPRRVHEAMRYSVLSAGKRLRPILCVAAIESLGKESEPFLPAACALELVHTYSLIHDDLPAMDNDDLRRGKPTCHRAFGEAVAILAGDALLTLAFEAVAGTEAAPPEARVELVKLLARGAGTAGMVGGQALDIEFEGKAAGVETVERIHAWKTAALVQASVIFGALLAGASVEQRETLSKYGSALGMAFQITDDILDATGDEAKAGKKLRRDEQRRKATYPALCGVEKSREIAERYISEALTALDRLDRRADPLREIARLVARRDR